MKIGTIYRITHTCSKGFSVWEDEVFKLIEIIDSKRVRVQLIESPHHNSPINKKYTIDREELYKDNIEILDTNERVTHLPKWI